MDYKIYTPLDPLLSTQRQYVVEFLYESLEEYGDEAKDIAKAIQYAMSDQEGKGGYVVVAKEDDKIQGVVVVNQTGMTGYIPENILVYIAVNGRIRGRGVGRKLMQLAIKFAKGGVALHVEPHNPARFLYEKLGFKNKYLEMRYEPIKALDKSEYEKE